MEMAKIFEALMLIIFGASWPAQIAKTIRVKDPKGKSFTFLYMVLVGYVCGLASKFMQDDWQHNWVIYIYVLDIIMVSTDTFLCHYYAAKRKAAEQKS